jgi:hypothetical protein
MANRVATILGVVFLLVGILGFVMPNLLGAHLSLAHNLIHLVSGAISLWLGLKGTPAAARKFCIVFGAVYLLLGIAGFVLGTGAERMLAVIPGQLDLGTMDHVIHVVLGIVYLIGGFMTAPVRATA